MKDVLLVTGSSGIAAATARMWATENPVFIVGINKEECHSLAKELGEAAFAVADVRDQSAVRDAVAACLERFGRIHALFNVAGVSARSAGDGPLHECKSEAWDTVMDVNAKGTFLMCREVLGVWTKSKQPGVILNTGSVLARHPQPDHFATAGYAASKGAIISMSRAMAAYYAPHKIRVNVIAPSLIRTPMSRRAQENPEILELMKTKQPLVEDLIEAEEVARAALFLLGDDARVVTGDVLTVDAG